MKRTPLMFAAMVPFVAVAAPTEQDQKAYKQLADDVLVTEILEATVQNRQGKEIGEVEDVILGRDGEIQSVLVDRFIDERRDKVYNEIIGSNKERRGEGREFAGVWGQQDTDRMQRLAVTEWAREDQKTMPRIDRRDDRNLEKTAGYDSEKSYDEPRNIHFEWNEASGFAGALTEIEWQDANYDDRKNIVRVNVEEHDMQRATYPDDEDFTSRGELTASEIIGTEVNLLDEDSFGEVENVLINPATNRASAYVVDSMDYFDRQVYALPANFDATSIFQDEVNYQFTANEVEQLGEFRLEDEDRS